MSQQPREITEELLNHIASEITDVFTVKRNSEGEFIPMNELEMAVSLLASDEKDRYYNYESIDIEDFEEFHSEGELLVIVGLQKTNYHLDFMSLIEIPNNLSDSSFSEFEKKLREDKGIIAINILLLTEIPQSTLQQFLEHVDTEPLESLLNAFPQETLYLQSVDLDSEVLYSNQVLDASNIINAFQDLLSPFTKNYVSPVSPTVGLSFTSLTEFESMKHNGDTYSATLYFLDLSEDTINSMVGIEEEEDEDNDEDIDSDISIQDSVDDEEFHENEDADIDSSEDSNQEDEFDEEDDNLEEMDEELEEEKERRGNDTYFALTGNHSEIMGEIMTIIEEYSSGRTPMLTNIVRDKDLKTREVKFDEGIEMDIINSIKDILDHSRILTNNF